jgi:hypothetical protein
MHQGRNMRSTRKILWLAALGSALALGGCGGNGDHGNGNVGSTSVPDSAGVSSAAFLKFLASLGDNDETSEPLTIGASFDVPADEVNDPKSFSELLPLS